MQSPIDALRAESSQSSPGLLARWAWSLINVVQFIVTLSFSAACISLALLVRVLTRSSKASLAMARGLWAPGLLALAGAPLRVEGLERLSSESTYLFVANHGSIMDVPALFRALPRNLHFVVKRELGRMPFLGWYVSAMGMVFVDRGARNEALASVGEAATLLMAGQNVMSFPEGTRSRDGRVGSFKSGVFIAAIESGASIVPVAITGAGSVIPPGGFRVRPGTIRVAVGTPIATVGLTKKDRGRLAHDARAAVIELSGEPAPSRHESPIELGHQDA
ncbi:MAG: lysophospholipid acyltransferase family protein [Acidobacteriota bacterium]